MQDDTFSIKYYNKTSTIKMINDKTCHWDDFNCDVKLFMMIIKSCKCNVEQFSMFDKAPS